MSALGCAGRGRELLLRSDGKHWLGWGGVGLEVNCGPRPKVGKLRPGLAGSRESCNQDIRYGESEVARLGERSQLNH